MSDTESFEYALWKAIDDCKIDESTDTITGSYTKSLSNQDRVVAAHIREIRDTAQQEYHRGYDDGQHSMDAEHRAIVMRLRALPLDGGSHENLSQIARAVHHADFGWTHGACASLRDELVRLMGGVSDDTCGSQCRGACTAGDGRDSGEHAEVSDDCVDCDILGPDSRGHAVGRDFHELGVSDGRTGDSCTRSHPLRSVGRNDVCMCRDFGEHSRGQEVEHGGAAHDCAADSRGRASGELVHMDGLVTYDVLDNERRKAIAELRNMKIDSSYYGNYRRIALAIGTVYDGESFASECFRDRLIHLLGGDHPSGIDVLREMDAESDDDGTCPNDDPTPSITDELRKFKGHINAGLTPEMVLALRAEINCIADRIDEQFDRICHQQEAVLQETIDDVVKEYEHDRLPDQLRIEKLVEQRDEARAKLDAIRDALDG